MSGTPAPRETVLELRDVEAGYGRVAPVPRGPSVTVRAGEVVCLVGRNARRALEMADIGRVLDLGRVHISGPVREPVEDPRLGSLYLGDSAAGNPAAAPGGPSETPEGLPGTPKSPPETPEGPPGALKGLSGTPENAARTPVSPPGTPKGPPEAPEGPRGTPEDLSGTPKGPPGAPGDAPVKAHTTPA
ncbi:hypothetical protein [Streptosporangium sp. NPDC002524]|uniref:hypothetical protein n=1 Tax=Streptosporangium sp. NPDC002524 TaxID=3154537 RepID=UPI00331E0F34